MVRIIVALCMVIWLIACSKPETIVKIVPQEVKVPVMMCPSEEIEKPGRPDLLIDDLTEGDKDNPGKIVKFWKGTVMQLMQYSEELEKSLDTHEDVCKTTEVE